MSKFLKLESKIKSMPVLINIDAIAYIEESEHSMTDPTVKVVMVTGREFIIRISYDELSGLLLP